MELMDLAPSGMAGWQEEFDDAPALLLERPALMKVRLFVSSRGITAMVAATDMAVARDALCRAGFPPDRVKVLLCG